MRWAVVLAFAIFAASACTTAPGPQQAPQAAARPTAAPQEFRAQMLAAVNGVRAARGLGALALSSQLNAAAQAHAMDLAPRGSISHTGSDGSNAGDRALRAGYDYRKVAENTAQGQAGVGEVVADWMDSPEHRANMLVPDMQELGVGFAEGVSSPSVPGRYWVILLGRR